MSEKIGNAITEQKNMVELMTADTMVIDSENANVPIFSPLIATNNEGYVMFYNGQFYTVSRANVSSVHLEVEILKINLPE